MRIFRTVPILFSVILAFAVYLTTVDQVLAFAASISTSTTSINRCTGSWPTITFNAWNDDPLGAKLYWSGPGQGWTFIRDISGGATTQTFPPPASTSTMGTYRFGIGDRFGNNPPSSSQVNVTFAKSSTRFSNFTVNNIAPAASENINFTGNLECQNSGGSWVGLSNQTVGVRNSSTGSQFSDTETTSSSGSFTVTYSTPSSGADIPAQPVYNGDAYFNAPSNPPTINVYPPLSCPSGTSYQASSIGSTWKIEGCGGNQTNNIARYANLKVTNKSGSSAGLSFATQRWMCYTKQTPATGRSFCSDVLQPQGVVETNVTCSGIPARTRVFLSSSYCGQNIATDSTPFDQNLHTDERSRCGSAQVDIWFSNYTVGPFWGFSSSSRSELQGHCGRSNLKAENIAVSPATPSPGTAISFTGDIANRGNAGTELGFNSRFNLDLNFGTSPGVDVTCVRSVGTQLHEGDVQAQVWNTASSGCTGQTAVLGTHRIELCADDGNTITEFDSTTNCSNITFTVSNLPPGAFTISSGNPTCSGSSPNNTITWSNSANVTPNGTPTGDRYLVSRSTSPSGSFTQIPNSPQTNPSTLTILDNDSGLANNTSYWYRVQAVNQAGLLYATEPVGGSTIESFQVTTLNCNNPFVDLDLTSPSGASSPNSATLPPGQSFTLTWTTTNTPSFCTVSGSWPNPATQRSAVSGSSEVLTAPATVGGPYAYTIQCTKNPGGIVSNTSTVNITVANLPTVNLVANGDADDDVTISPGPAQASLTWAIGNTITSCTPTSNPTDSTWNSRTISASSAAPVLTQSLAVSATPYIYTLTCINTSFPSSIAGRSAVDSVNITISNSSGSSEAWIQTTGGDVHSNTEIDTSPGR